MAEPEERFTLPRTKLPPQQALPPTLLFHRWQRYDCFWPDSFIDDRGKVQTLTPFKQDFTGFRFLDRVAGEVQRQAQNHYRAWYEKFSRAFDHLEIEPVIKATTLWRLVVGWGTNPAFETGITLDHLLGFPCIPGSAVKGLLHRVAEQELLEGPAGIPEAPGVRPDEPPPALVKALARARRVRALFGSLHLRRAQRVVPGTAPNERKFEEVGPEAPFNRLAAWLALLEPDQESESWTDIRRQLVRLCSDAPAGGMITCFDAVPDPKVFSETRKILTPDVLTPHKDNQPNPIPFLAVRDGVTFELRYRLAAWPTSPPRDREEEERAADLHGMDRKTVAEDLKRWLVRGLKELGLGGKTSAGYGYLLAEGERLPVPRPLKEPPLPAAPKEVLTEEERQARAALPQGIDETRAVDALDKALKGSDPAVQAAVVQRFNHLFPDALGKWRTKQGSAMKKRVAAVDRVLSRIREDKP